MKRAIAIITVLVLCLCMLPMAAFAANDVTLYLKPNSNWLMDGARFAAYTWDIGDAWFDATDSDNDGFYEIKVPAGVSNIIFCRMNPGTTENNWNNKWNQTADLVIPTDGANCYTVADGTWDKGGGNWSVFGDTTPSEPQPEPDPVYVVAGDSGLCNGINWGQADQTNRMTLSGGIYTITFEDVLPGAYGFKVVKNGDWNQAWPSSNYNITVEAVSDVTITYNPDGNVVDCKIVPTGEIVEIIDKYVVAGDEGLTGESWNPNSENVMTEKDGVYEITYKDVAAGTYGFKVVKNGSWATSWPGENYSITLEATSDVTITFNPANDEISVSIVSGGVAVADKYVVAGSAGLCGSEWAAADEANLMTETSEGVYAITYTNVAAGDYELKVVKNGTQWIGGSDGNNVKITVSEACDVTVTYSEANGIVVTGDHVGPTVEDAPSTDDKPSTGDTPTTGDAMDLVALTALTILSGTALVLLKKKEF